MIEQQKYFIGYKMAKISFKSRFLVFIIFTNQVFCFTISYKRVYGKKKMPKETQLERQGLV